MKTFENLKNQECFKSDPILDWDPVQVLQGGGDVCSRPGVSICDWNSICPCCYEL